MVQTLEGPLPPGATTGRPSEVGDPEPVAEKGERTPDISAHDVTRLSRLATRDEKNP